MQLWVQLHYRKVETLQILLPESEFWSNWGSIDFLDIAEARCVLHSMGADSIVVTHSPNQ